MQEQRGRDAPAQGLEQGCGIFVSEKDDQSDIRHAFFRYPAGINGLNGEIFVSCFLVRFERQLYGSEDDRKISYVACCHGCDK